MKTPRVPHLTLYGPFRLDREVYRDRTDLYDSVKTIAEKHRPLHYSVDGLELKKKSDGRYVFAFNIDTSESLRRLRDDLVEGLGEFSTPKNEWDETPGDAWFHITIANNLPKRKAKEIKSRLSNTPLKDRLLGLLGKRKEKLKEPIMPIDPLRLTVLYRGRVLREYDLPRREWLHRASALDWKSWGPSLRLYRREKGFELLGPVPTSNDGPRTFVISDTHFHHSNIIKYYFRPFLRCSVDEMNRVLIDNWNRRVNPEDEVYFLGDLAYRRRARDDEHYLRQLNGSLV